MEELRLYLDGIEGTATLQEGQVVLGAAQLMLLPHARDHRGGAQVTELLELVLSRWDAFPDTQGFHATELLRNAFAAIGGDAEWIARLLALVPPDAPPELQLEIAAAHAAAGDRPALLEAVRTALAAGVSVEQLRRHPDLVAFAGDPELEELFQEQLVPGADALAPPIEALVAHYTPLVSAALEGLLTALRALGQEAHLREPASLEAVLAIERARGIELPNDYRALLAISDGFAIWEHEFAGTQDLRTETPLARAARAFLAGSSLAATPGLENCIPLARCGHPDEWLLHDPRGAVRGGEPGYILWLATGAVALDDLPQVLAYVAQCATHELGTN